MRPTTSEYFSVYERYISLVPETDILAVLENQLVTFPPCLAALDDEKAGFRYAPEKWSVRELVGHVIDTERVFGYRALCIARGETLSLHSFNERDYAEKAGHDHCSLMDLVDEFTLLRRSHLLMLRHLEASAWQRLGRVNDHPASTLAIAFLMAGHVRHHAAILTSRYGVDAKA